MAGPAPPIGRLGARDPVLAAAGLVVAATLARVAWLVRDALRPCTGCAEVNLPDFGPLVAALGTAYGLLYALLAGAAALSLARALGAGRRRGGLLALAPACLALLVVHGIEARASAPFFVLNAAALAAAASLVARTWWAETPHSARRRTGA